VEWQASRIDFNHEKADKLVSTCEEVSRQDAKIYNQMEVEYYANACLDKADLVDHLVSDEEKKIRANHFELYKIRTTAVVKKKFPRCCF
jgi:accessory colonization factor AcfC